VSPSRRRDVLHAGALLAADATIGPAERAARLSRAISAAAPDPLTLAQLDHGLHQIVAGFDVTPLDALADPIERGWDHAETLLAGTRSGNARRDLERLAGWHAYYGSRLAHSKDGDGNASLAFLVLAGQHADAARDTLLAGAVADMRAALAFFAGQYTTAAAIARKALIAAHPYVLPSLASQLARALAQCGDDEGALAALRTMHDNVWHRAQLPGPPPSDEEAYEAYSAITLSYLGRGDDAEVHGRRSLVLLAGSGRHNQLSGTHLALARAFLRRSEPDPERAAAALANALTAADGNSHGRTATRAARIYRHLASEPDWARIPAVRDLRDRLTTPRALTSGPPV
jgi:hypothetical protein